MLFIPTSFDLIATVLMNVGLLSGGGLPTTLPYTQPCSRHGRSIQLWMYWGIKCSSYRLRQ